MSESTLQLRVTQATYKAQGVLEFELRDPAGRALPAFTSGAHIDLQLEPGLTRSYSLCSAPGRLDAYRVAVALDPQSRGGSKFLHERALVGRLVNVGAPRNNFPLEENARHTLLIAGGIGITPLFAMAQRLVELGRSWEMVYAARGAHTAAYVDDLRELARWSGAKLSLHFGADRADLGAIVSQADPDTHAYCCGPASMIDAFRPLAEARFGEDRVHVEHFKAAAPSGGPQGGFEILLKRSGRVLRVDEGSSILDALLGADIDIPYSCMEGICGSCQIKVLDGTPDHRDAVLSSRQRASNDVLIACCSRSKSGRLALDL